MDETVAPAPPPARSIGERLRAGRERAGLSQAAAAEKLHLDIKVIEALEADRFAELGASVYVRGHLRRYADFVGEPGIEMVSAYSAREAPPPPPDLTQVPKAGRRADPRRLVTPFVGLGTALALALAIWWVLAGPRPGASNTASAPAATAAAPAATAAAPAPASPPAALAPTAAEPAARTAAAAPANGAANGARDAATEAPPAPVREMRLTLQLSSESWVEVYDSSGERLFYDVASAGSVQNFQGPAPLRVVLGNAAAVAVQVDGEQREIPAGAVSGDEARFTVSSSGSLRRSRQ